MKKLILLISSILLLLVPCTVEAAGSEEEKMDIILVLDCSQSMSDVDAGYMAFDFVKEFVSVIPSHYALGIIGYSQEICVCLPVGCTPSDIEQALQEVTYRNYGNAGAGLTEAVSLLKGSTNNKKIIMISDGENLMRTPEETESSKTLFEIAAKEAKNQNITVDIINLGDRIEEANIYSAADTTGGNIYDLEDGEAFASFAEEYLFQEMEIPARPIGRINGMSGELKIQLPDCLMKKAKIALLGRQENENLTVSCEAEEIEIFKGISYTVLELENPVSEDIAIQISSEINMDIDAYLMAEYEFFSETDYTYLGEEQKADISVSLENHTGKNLLSGHLADDGLSVLLNGNEQGCVIRDGRLIMERQTMQDETVELELKFDDAFGIYFGDKTLQQEITVPMQEEVPEDPDWFFWITMGLFLTALFILFLFSRKKKKKAPSNRKMIDESRTLPDGNNVPKSDFFGKILVYVIHNKEDIDYPPGSINLFARCSREVITLEWILDACNLPLNLKGAEKIIIKPGEDRSLVIRNNSHAAAMKGRELLLKGRLYHLYYHEKVTFIFDQEDAEIEVHYKDLKPNEK